MTAIRMPTRADARFFAGHRRWLIVGLLFLVALVNNLDRQTLSVLGPTLREKLGFGADFLYGSPPFYGSVSRGDVCLHLRCVDQPNFTELAAREVSLILATIEVSDVHALYAEFSGRGVEFAQIPIHQPWGGTDFQVRDLDGNVISFVTYG